jgi:hypothetical protein
LFIATADNKFTRATLGDLKGRPALTVGSLNIFCRRGGMIGFFPEDNEVRFEINLTAAEHAPLKISARLLSLAKTVIGSPKGT